MSAERAFYELPMTSKEFYTQGAEGVLYAIRCVMEEEESLLESSAKTPLPPVSYRRVRQLLIGDARTQVDLLEILRRRVPDLEIGFSLSGDSSSFAEGKTGRVILAENDKETLLPVIAHEYGHILQHQIPWLAELSTYYGFEAFPKDRLGGRVVVQLAKACRYEPTFEEKMDINALARVQLRIFKQEERTKELRLQDPQSSELRTLLDGCFQDRLDRDDLINQRLSQFLSMPRRILEKDATERGLKVLDEIAEETGLPVTAPFVIDTSKSPRQLAGYIKKHAQPLNGDLYQIGVNTFLDYGMQSHAHAQSQSAFMGNRL